MRAGAVVMRYGARVAIQGSMGRRVPEVARAGKGNAVREAAW
ncbi:Hypothetical protein CAP_5599 [Chondromyces apiculatus DSM 436]|uniref:Uncharacterized protein n=1 Tax=Chondromyces apiculatus DSM 436 TaxID=1192034 RepID=A0A017T495_9BACT|nr:Hypothetical protein CAP_5599 [Chondromyces apiculatus DSM 436]